MKPLLLLFLICLPLLGGCANKPKSKATSTTSIMAVRGASEDGRFIVLHDGSVWNVDWDHADTAAALQPGAGVLVFKEPNDGSFPFRMRTREGAIIPVRLGRNLD